METTLEKYLNERNNLIAWNNTKDLLEFIRINNITFDGEECGGLKFCKYKSGRKYITLIEHRCRIN